MRTTEFKDTELGPIPKDWEVKRVGEIGEPLMCRRVLKSQTSSNGEIPFYKIGTFGKKPDAYMSRALFDELRRAYSYPRKGDVLISAAGTIGRVVVFDGKDAYFQDSNIVWVDNDESVALNEYLLWCYRVAKWTTEDGGTVSRLYNANLKAQRFLRPPLPEQRRIAAALGDVDKLIENLKKRVEKKKNLKRGAMQELLTGKRRLRGLCDLGERKDISRGERRERGELFTTTTEFKDTELGPIPKDWEVRRLGEVFDIGSSKRVFQSQWREQGIPFWRARDLVSMRNGAGATGGLYIDEQLYAQYKNAYGVPKIDDLLVTAVGTLGVVYRVRDDKPFYFKDGNIICMSTKGLCESRYIEALFSGGYLDDQICNTAGGSTVGTYTISSANKTVVALPPLPEQRAIAAVLSDMDAEIANLEAKLKKMTLLKQGMMQDLLTGKVRLT